MPTDPKNTAADKVSGMKPPTAKPPAPATNKLSGIKPQTAKALEPEELHKEPPPLFASWDFGKKRSGDHA